MTPTCGPRRDEPRHGRAGRSGLGGAFAASQPLAGQALVFEARPAVSLDALSPFGRGANAPLAGRTILQIVPPLAAGGDERATLAVTAALAETGARALVATRFRASWPANCRRSAASSSAFRRRPRTRSRWRSTCAVCSASSLRSGSTSSTCARVGRPGRRSRPAARRSARLSPRFRATAAARVRAPASRPPSPRATLSSRRPNSPPGARKRSFPRLPSASGSSVREWISPSFSRNG